MAVVLACATFPLIWIGGLVTTVDAGMAVEDWPTTFGYSMFLYPLVKWVYGPADVFFEHGHRLYASCIGLLTIATLVVTWMYESRRWVLALSVAALALVIGQGLLGGLRVIEDQVLLAKIHGCVGPLFFALCAAWATVTSKCWQQSSTKVDSRFAAAIQRLALLTTLLAYVQLVLGAQLRHIPLTMTPSAFRTALVFHLFVAAVLALHIIALAILVWLPSRQDKWVRRPATTLVALLLAQLALGAGTWVTKYGYPNWFVSTFGAPNYVVTAEGPAQVLITTTHVAIGSLILVVSLLIALRSFRLLSQTSRSTATVAVPMIAMGVTT
jgi:cytochrome c oxidase assembly protein subunit 15